LGKMSFNDFKCFSYTITRYASAYRKKFIFT